MRKFELSAHSERKAYAFRNTFYIVFTDRVLRFYPIFYCVVWRRIIARSGPRQRVRCAVTRR